MVLAKNWPFFPVFYFKEYRPGKCVLRYCRTKNGFLRYKKKTFKKSKNEIFVKGLVHGFAQKLAICPTFILGNIGLKNVFYDILEQKNAV